MGEGESAREGKDEGKDEGEVEVEGDGEGTARWGTVPLTVRRMHEKPTYDICET